MSRPQQSVPRSPVRSRRRLALVVPLVAAGAVLTGCGIHPGDAARVGGFTFSRADLDQVTAAQCVLAASPAEGQSSNQKTSRATTAQTTIALVVQARQGIRYAETHDVKIDTAQLRLARSSFDDQLSGKGLSRAQRDSLLDVSDLVSRGQLVAQTVGAKSLGLPSTQTSAAQQALQRGSQIVGRWAARSGPSISIDPRYNIGVKGGQLRLRDSSVSTPVSTAGKQSASQQPSSSYVTSLPVPQRCG